MKNQYKSSRIKNHKITIGARNIKKTLWEYPVTNDA